MRLLQKTTRDSQRILRLTGLDPLPPIRAKRFEMLSIRRSKNKNIVL